MSLINEALKKAQKLRATEQAGETMPPIPGAVARVTKRGQARSSQTVVLIASGAIVLVVLSVVATFWLVNRPSPSPVKPVPTTKSGSKPGTTTELPPAIVPAITPAPTTPAPIEPTPPTASATSPAPSTGEITTRGAETKKPEMAVAPAETKTPATSVPPAPVPAATAPATTSTGIAATRPPASPPTTSSAPVGTSSIAPATSAPATPAPATPATPAPPKPDERIAAFVDSLRVTAIRANDNKVIMNDRVYRVNDIVERTMGIKLVKVAPDSLTFADANGITYVKYF